MMQSLEEKFDGVLDRVDGLVENVSIRILFLNIKCLTHIWEVKRIRLMNSVLVKAWFTTILMQSFVEEIIRKIGSVHILRFTKNVQFLSKY